jgi:all-trans-nonaprenyl-diphosphate synthase
LGKPACSDLKSGNLTAPTLYALEEKPGLEKLIQRELAQEGDLEEAIELIKDSHGIERSRQLAAEHAKMAVKHLQSLPDCNSRQALINLADYVLSRLY